MGRGCNFLPYVRWLYPEWCAQLLLWLVLLSLLPLGGAWASHQGSVWTRVGSGRAPSGRGREHALTESASFVVYKTYGTLVLPASTSLFLDCACLR